MAEGTVLVTGAAKRIGRAISLRLSGAGYCIAVHYRGSSSEAEEVVATIEKSGGTAFAIQADLADAESASNLVRLASIHGPLCGIVNNASLFFHDDIHSIDSDSWDAHMDVNAKSPLLLIRSLNEILEEGHSACVVNVLDQKIAEPNPDHLSYTASRYAMLGLTDALARGLAPSIRVNAVAPGHTLPSDDQTEEGFARAQSESPLGYGPRPEDIADAVCYLIGARAVTGQILFVDSGERFLSRARDVLFETE
ncbi:MAG: SDR family oxidoreductase [Candidatus Thermoplasmatota archaeon]|nr:short chain dehydrogenase [Euryarchaeota archaeon]MBJ32382.1 short chain dehydrogenase [Euryarchaeota archaeon]MED5452376.1 SDR family oxidoreductase [Candidatus Thermoplasmatota archaeon]|tara:strand:+ start:842 stop:1597 length:756 start_codon:yes stop_codon:yes gene_type:complete